MSVEDETVRPKRAPKKAQPAGGSPAPRQIRGDESRRVAASESRTTTVAPDPVQQKRANVLIHGVVHPSLFDQLKERDIRQAVITEGRPGLEAARSNARAMLARRIVPVVISDNMPGFLFSRDWIKEIWIAYQDADGEGAICEIGALILAILGQSHRVPVHGYPAGQKKKLIGKGRDLMDFNGRRVMSKSVKTYVPLLEWVPKKYFQNIYR